MRKLESVDDSLGGQAGRSEEHSPPNRPWLVDEEEENKEFVHETKTRSGWGLECRS